MRKYLLFGLLTALLFQNSSGQNKQNVIFPKRNCLGLAEDKTGTVKISIRCQATINYTPLFVVDGIVAEETEIKKIEPNDIENIWILKDTMAQALYGCRAMSDIVIITTKKANEKALIIRDFLTYEPLAGASVTINKKDGNDSLIHLIADSNGRISIKNISFNETFEMSVSISGYKSYTRYFNSSQLQKESTILLEREYKELQEVRVKNIQAKNKISNGLYGWLKCLCCGLNVLGHKDNIEKSTSVQNNFKIYPNPATRFSNINLEYISRKSSKLTFQLFGIDYKLIDKREFLANVGVNRISYKINSKISAGIYLVHLFAENNELIKTEQLIIK